MKAFFDRVRDKYMFNKTKCLVVTITDTHYREDTLEKDQSSYIAARILRHV